MPLCAGGPGTDTVIMMKKLLKRLREQGGFTLVEILVVVGVIGILNGIAVPTFLRTTNEAREARAAAQLHEDLTHAKAYYVEHATYEGFVAARTTLEEATESTVVLTAFASAGKFVCVADDTGRGTVWGRADASSWDDCDAAPDK